MRISLSSKLILAAVVLVLGIVPASAQAPPDVEAAKMFPAAVGDFRARGAASRTRTGSIFERTAPEDFNAVSEASRAYVAPNGESFNVTLVKTRSDSAAYSLLTTEAPQAERLAGVGTDARARAGLVSFYKGPAFVRVNASRVEGDSSSSSQTALVEFARLFAEKLEAGEASVPALAQHLPDWERAQAGARYAVSLPALQSAAGDRPVLDALSFEGGAEAVTANYGGARLVIVEFTTPQYAFDNDARLGERIAQLRAEGKPTPSGYRRVGNYSVFVFDAAEEAAAAQLMDGVKYEKDVRWLGDNPRALEQAQRAYGVMTGNVIYTSLKITGLSILLCLGVGGLFGGAVYLHRRMQSATTEIYSDAGGMVRLNIDEITPEAGSARLLGKGER